MKFRKKKNNFGEVALFHARRWTDMTWLVVAKSALKGGDVKFKPPGRNPLIGNAEYEIT
jgi:hypothetical protein